MCEFFCRALPLDPDIEVADSSTVIPVTESVHRLTGADISTASPIMPKLILISRGSPLS